MSQENREDKEGFTYSYSAPTETERKEIESIRREYVDKTDHEKKFDRLRSLDKKVKTYPSVIAISTGVIGILIFGLGMSCALVWEQMTLGIIIGIIGAAIMAAAYPVFAKLLKAAKKKYGDEILKLSDELLGKNRIN